MVGGIDRAWPMTALHPAALSSVLAGAGCASSSILGSTLGQAAVLRVGQVADFPGEGLRVGFTAVSGDSRCPPPETGVVCVWQGVATVAAWAQKSPQPRSEIVLATTNAAGHSRQAEYLNYEIELLGLAPPHAGTIRQSDYRLTLLVRPR
jgi:hypothetical protein